MCHRQLGAALLFAAGLLALASPVSAEPFGTVAIEGEVANSGELERLRRQFGATRAGVDRENDVQFLQVPLSRRQEFTDALVQSSIGEQVLVQSYAGSPETLMSPAAESELTPAQLETLEALSVRGRRPQILRAASAMATRFGFANGFGAGRRSGFQFDLGSRSVRFARAGAENAAPSEWAGLTDLGETARLSAREEDIYGVIDTPESVIEIRPLGSGLHAVIETPRQEIGGDEPPAFHERAPIGDVQGGVGDAPQRLSVVDTLVVYTQGAAIAAGASPSTLFGEKRIDGVNTAFQNGRLQNVVRLNLARVAPVTYDDGPDVPWDSHVAMLGNPRSALRRQIDPIRDDVRADIVVLVIADGAWCGEALSIGPNQDTAIARGRAFAVVNQSCISNLSFEHEVGHLFGLRHDINVDTATQPYQWGHGLVMETLNERTVMAYPDHCNGCPRIQRWSDASATYKNTPLGSADWENEVRVIRATAPRLAALY